MIEEYFFMILTFMERLISVCDDLITRYKWTIPMNYYLSSNVSRNYYKLIEMEDGNILTSDNH